MPKGTFDARIDDLIEMVGAGLLVGRVEYDQVYAHRQHVEATWQHPRGGQAFYLSTPLYGMMNDFMENLATHTLEEGGPTLGMVENVEALAAASSALTPKEWLVLEGSAHPTVETYGMTVYDRPPRWPRLDDATLDQLHEMWSDMFPENHPWKDRNRQKLTRRQRQPIRIQPGQLKITKKPRPIIRVPKRRIGPVPPF